MGNEHSKPVAVIELGEDEHPTYKRKKLETMLKNGPAGEDTKVFVICISGVYRSGKSFLLNLLQTYMDHYCEKGADAGWIGNDDVKIKGGNWAQGQLTVTHGIWMYMYPQLVDNKAIILMDCQGTKDVMKSTPMLDNQIMFLALQLSDVHILNVERSLGADDIERLGLCLYHADDDDSTEKLFRRQIFLIRNWANREEPQQLDEIIESTASGSIRDTAIGIQNAFEAVDVVSLPNPGPGVDGKSESSNVYLRDVHRKFLQRARALFHRLIQEFPLQAKFNCQEFLQIFHYASSRAVGKINSLQEAYEESLIQGLYRQLMESVNVQIEQLKTETSQLTVDEVQERVATIFDEVKNHFMNHKRVERCQRQTIIEDHLHFMEKNHKDIETAMVNLCKMAALTSENEQKKGMLAETQEELHHAKEDLERQNAKIEQVQKSAEQIQEQLQREKEIAAVRMQEQEKANAKRMNQLKENHQQQLKRTTEAFESANKSLAERAKIERNLKSEQAKELKKVRDEGAQSLKDLKANNYEHLERLLKEKDTHQAQLSQLYANISKIQNDKVQLEKDKAAKQRQIDSLKSEMEAYLSIGDVDGCNSSDDDSCVIL